MSGDIDAAGGLMDAGLTAKAIEGERHAAATGHEAGHHRCANCGAHLAGAYCHACGQSGHVHRSFLHVLEEFFHGILHFDGKVWRTFPMLAFRPGALTRRYVHGHRVRYVSPLALFLFSVFLMFFGLSFIDHGGGDSHDVQSWIEGRAELQEGVDEAKADLKDAEDDLAEAVREGGNVARATARRDKLAQKLKATENALRALDVAGVAVVDKTNVDKTGADKTGKVDAAGEASTGAPPADADTAAYEPDWVTAAKRLADRKDGKGVNLGIPVLDEHIRHALRNPELTLYKMKHSAAKLSFLLVPLSVPFLWLMFLFRRGVYLYDHVVFVLHSLSFMAVLTAVAAVMSRAGAGASIVGSLMCFVPPIHMYAHVKGAYHLGTLSALWRTIVLLWVAAAVLTTYLLFIISVGLVE